MEGLTSVLLAGVSASVLALAGCSAGGSLDALDEPWTSDDATWMQPAGTPLGAGLVVPADTQLIGPVFSKLGRTSPIDGAELFASEQRAYLFSNADILDVSSDIVEQLGGAGAVESDYNGSICNQEIDRGGNLARTPEAYNGSLNADAVEVTCSGLLPNSLAEEGPGLSFELRQDVADREQPVLGIVSWAEPDVVVPETLPDAPDGVGGPHIITTDVERDPDLDVVDGSFVAGPQGWGSITGGFTAVIGVTGSPDEVFDEYLRYQMPDPPPAEDDAVGDLRVRRGTTGGEGGVTYSVTLNEMGDNAWILVEAYND